jgi:hypothetical protein
MPSHFETLASHAHLDPITCFPVASSNKNSGSRMPPVQHGLDASGRESVALPGEIDEEEFSFCALSGYWLRLECFGSV